ncbi:MAG: translation initiation factor IF-3 [Chloroflexi bacterium]|nr:translation initiation factor IF-3 [Chloroflexota bacterium]MBU1747664.1 translation initiation factor IF-3 [Chloroflexota bacterium]MBU1877614.1 translation initiation factor IF-3 [Chloroflexota bacterium]
MKDLRINRAIRSRQVRVIDEEGKQLGIFTIQEALDMANERDLDLVEVAPNARPPVCRFLDYGKYRYEQDKKERESRKAQKSIMIKEIRMRPKTDDHDLETKVRRAREFLLNGDKVKVTIRFRGRERSHPEIGQRMLDYVLELLRDVSEVERAPSAAEGLASISAILRPTGEAAK